MNDDQRARQTEIAVRLLEEAVYDGLQSAHANGREALVFSQTCIVIDKKESAMVAIVSGKQRCGRCGNHGSGEICGTFVGGR
ncbi:MAG: hypothetical protein OXE87_06465, partial [Chloroflexi bacterium]|nr:hypothetical protein [Chloroflexota bacterium]